MWAHSCLFLTIPGCCCGKPASLVAVSRLSSRDTQVWLPHGMWDISSPSRDWTHTPELEGGFLTTGPPGKPFTPVSHYANPHCSSCLLQGRGELAAQVREMGEKICISKWPLHGLPTNLPVFSAALYSGLLWSMVSSSPDALWASTG